MDVSTSECYFNVNCREGEKHIFGIQLAVELSSTCPEF